MEMLKNYKNYFFLLVLVLGISDSFCQTSRNLGLTGGPDGDYTQVPTTGTFNLTFNNVPGVNPPNSTPLPGGSLQIVIAVPPGIEVADSYSPPNGWTYLKSGNSTAVLTQVGPISSSPPASFVVFAVPLNIVAEVDEGVWSAQIQRILPTYQDPDPTNNTPSGTVSASSSVLPVNLVSFEAAKEGLSANLSWVTTEEVNSDRFEIQHSQDVKTWKTLGSVPGEGNSRVQNRYTFTHSVPVKGINYYRLKMIDRDGTYEYSPIESIKIEGDPSDLTIVYPNPVRPGESLTVETVANGLVKQIELISGAGIKVYESLAPKEAINKVQTDSYPAGLYLVRVRYVDGTSSVSKVVLAR